MKVVYTWILFSSLSAFFSELHAQNSPIQAGAAYFQVINSDASGNQNEAFYPRVAAPNKNSATTYPSAPLSAPFRLHSWMGGAMLWATGTMETDGNGYFVAQQPISIINPGPTQTQTWPSPVFQQGPVIADPILFAYSQPPNIPNSNPNTRGIQLSLPYPYLAPEVPYSSTCGNFANESPLVIHSDPIPMLLLYPSNSPPTAGVAAGDTVWMPPAMLVDNMGDYSANLIYQNPAAPYAGSGNGSYIKCTVVQGSPYVFFECQGIQYIAVTNQITVSTPVNGLIMPPVAAASIPTLPANFQYALLGGIQIDPGQFSEGNTLNPIYTDPTTSGGQACYTTWAVYFNNTAGTFTTTDMSTTAPQNSYFTITNTNTPFYFVIAALPTIYQYPYAPPPVPPNTTFANAYTYQTTNAGFNVVNYAQALGLYAFNFITNTSVTYSVANSSIANTTFTPTLAQPYGPTSVTNTTLTVMCLMPHHYQNQVFDQGTALSPTVLPVSANWSAFSPAGTGSLFYWDIRGNLKTILGSSFMTQYVFSNFLPTMPPPAWLDTVTLGGSSFTGAPDYAGQPTTIGQLLFDSLDSEFINNLAASAYAPWNTAYTELDKGIYDVGKTLAKGAKQLGLLLHYIQGYEENNANPMSSTYNFFGNGTQPGSANFGPPFFYNTMPPFTSLYEQQYNNPFTRRPSRPGAFDANSGITPLPSMIQALRTSLQTSVAGSTSPVLPGVEGAIVPYFAMSPTPCTGGAWQLSHYAFYDTVANLVMLYPSAGSPSNQGQITPWPGRKGTLPAPAGAGGVFESFGVADAFNDHHYQYGWWISAAALAAIYDGSWPSTPATNPYGGTGLPWADPTNYGTGIDQLVKDIAYDPSVTDFYQDNNMMMQFAKMNFFDQWAGHGWADGIQATIAGGNAGHNENSIGEALQAYASIILWGMATQRQDVVNLGIYLYTTTSYAMDSYFFDKNLNYVEGAMGGGSFVPTVTSTTSPTYAAGTGFWDYTIHNTAPVTSGTPKIAQGVINYSADFGQTPQNVRVINAFPCSSFFLVFGRNRAYLNAWNAAMDTANFCSTIGFSSSPCWTIAFTSNINMLRALGGNATSLGVPGTSCPGSALSPYAGMVQIFTSQPSGIPANPFGNPPWASTGGAYADPGQSINEVLHFLHTIDHYGTPDWNYYGYGSGLVFTAAFTKAGTTTYFAFNPTFSPVTVQFYQVSNNAPVAGTSMTVSPKRWAQVHIP